MLRVFPLMFYPGTPLYERAKADGLIDTRDRAAYDFMGTGALQFAKHDYLAIWLRLVLNLRNLGVPRWVAHRVVDLATGRAVRRVLDRKWFGPTVFIAYQAGRKIVRNLIHQPLVKPLKYLRRGRRRGAEQTWKLPPVDVAAMRQRVVASASARAAGIDPGWGPKVGRGLRGSGDDANRRDARSAPIEKE